VVEAEEGELPKSPPAASRVVNRTACPRTPSAIDLGPEPRACVPRL